MPGRTVFVQDHRQVPVRGNVSVSFISATIFLISALFFYLLRARLWTILQSNTTTLNARGPPPPPPTPLCWVVWFRLAFCSVEGFFYFRMQIFPNPLAPPRPRPQQRCPHKGESGGPTFTHGQGYFVTYGCLKGCLFGAAFLIYLSTFTRFMAFIRQPVGEK